MREVRRTAERQAPLLRAIPRAVGDERRGEGVDSAWDGAEERCLPFRCTTHLAHFVVVLMPGPRFGLRTLDATMAAAHAWDERWRQDVRPAFYDWEASRWISARRWIPPRARRGRSAEGASPP